MWLREQDLNEVLLCSDSEAALSFKKDSPIEHSYQNIEKVMILLSKLPQNQTHRT
jgi:hypothetical protein